MLNSNKRGLVRLLFPWALLVLCLGLYLNRTAEVFRLRHALRDLRAEALETRLKPFMAAKEVAAKKLIEAELELRRLKEQAAAAAAQNHETQADLDIAQQQLRSIKEGYEKRIFNLQNAMQLVAEENKRLIDTLDAATKGGASAPPKQAAVIRQPDEFVAVMRTISVSVPLSQKPLRN